MPYLTRILVRIVFKGCEVQKIGLVLWESGWESGMGKLGWGSICHTFCPTTSFSLLPEPPCHKFVPPTVSHLFLTFLLRRHFNYNSPPPPSTPQESSSPSPTCNVAHIFSTTPAPGSDSFVFAKVSTKMRVRGEILLIISQTSSWVTCVIMLNADLYTSRSVRQGSISVLGSWGTAFLFTLWVYFLSDYTRVTNIPCCIKWFTSLCKNLFNLLECLAEA